MKTYRILLVLVSLTIVVQGALLYQRSGKSSAENTAATESEGQDSPNLQQMTIDLRDLPTKGRSDAKVVLVEYSDYECPFCAKHANAVGPELERMFVANGKLRIAFANNPLSIHEHAPLLATAAVCAGQQGKYWEMHDGLFAERPRTKPALLSLAGSLKLDVSSFETCLDKSVKPAEAIIRDTQEAERLGLRGTPGFALGVVDKNGRVTVKQLISGAQPLEVFREAIDRLITD